MMENLNIILTSSLVAGIVSAIISYIISVQLKKLDFKNEYYKEILKKRLATYEHIEAQLSIFKAVVLDQNDSRPYHQIFGLSEEQFVNCQKSLVLAFCNNLWIDDETVKKLEDLNEIFYNINMKVYEKNQAEIIEIGKQYYQNISDLRFELENSTKKGLYDLHNMKKAFKPKKRNSKRAIREFE